MKLFFFLVVLRHSIEIYDVGQSESIKGNPKVPAVISLQTLLVEEKKRGRGEERK